MKKILKAEKREMPVSSKLTGGNRRFRNYLKQNKGETLMVAILIMLVVMMVTVAILTAAFALFQTVNGQSIQTQCHILAMDVSDILDAQITSPMDRVPDPSKEGAARQIDAEEFKSRMEKRPGGQPAIIQSENPLWYYIRSNIYQNSWPYWDSNNEDLNHLDSIAWKEFQLDAKTTAGKNASEGYDVRVIMYWLDDEGGVGIDPTQPRPHDDFSARLVVRVVCTCGKYESNVTTEYMLNISRFADPQPELDPLGLTITTASGNQIYWQENWQFDRYTRR